MISYEITEEALDFMVDDHEYTDEVISKVTDCKDAWELSTELGSILIPKVNTPFEPKEDMTVRFYGKGLGYTVRGVTFPHENIIFYYRTPAEAKADHDKAIEEQNIQKKANFEKNKAKFEESYNSYPDVFKQRVDRFKKNNPDFEWKFLDYEDFCISEAVKIANKLKTVERIDQFREMDWGAQRMLVDIDSDHSGNTFSCSIGLAKLYLTNPEDIAKVHGAMCPLLGCLEYGCVSKEVAEKIREGEEVFEK